MRFSGEAWSVRGDPGVPRGPGPNFFGTGSGSVRVDRQGRLRLRLKRRGKGWVCAEVASARAFGRGTFRWTISSISRDLPHGVVLGLFTWAGDAPPDHREADIEFLDEGVPEVLFSVQPAQEPGRSVAFSGRLSLKRSTHLMRLRPDKVEFESGDGPEARHWASEVPVKEGPVRAVMNLWVREGAAIPEDAVVDVVFESFAFEPE
jgi:hypothetical protein